MKELKTAARVAAGAVTAGTSELAYSAVGPAAGNPFGSAGAGGVASIVTTGTIDEGNKTSPDIPGLNFTEDDENKAAADESEAEARRRRRGMLRRVFTTPGSNFVNQSNIGRNTLTGE